MNSRLRKGSIVVPTLVALLISLAGSGVAHSAQTGLGPGPEAGGSIAGPRGASFATAGGVDGRGKQCAGMKGGGRGQHGKKHGKHRQTKRGKHLFGASWRQSLGGPQKLRLDQLHVNHARIKAPLKARIKALKVELAVLATALEPDKAVIDAKIKEMLELKGQLAGAEYGYIAAQRQVLTPAQQVSFDMETIHAAMHGSKGKRGKGAQH